MPGWLFIVALVVFAVAVPRTKLGQLWMGRMRHPTPKRPRATQADAEEFRIALPQFYPETDPFVVDNLFDVWLEDRAKTGETAEAFLRRLRFGPEGTRT